MLTVLKYIALIGTFFIYTTSGVFSKLASQREFLSPGYIAFIACTVGVLGIYAVLWQQIIKRMDVSMAYMFKGTGVVFGLLLAHFVFGEAMMFYALALVSFPIIDFVTPRPEPVLTPRASASRLGRPRKNISGIYPFLPSW